MFFLSLTNLIWDYLKIAGSSIAGINYVTPLVGPIVATYVKGWAHYMATSAWLADEQTFSAAAIYMASIILQMLATVLGYGVNFYMAINVIGQLIDALPNSGGDFNTFTTSLGSTDLLIQYMMIIGMAALSVVMLIFDTTTEVLAEMAINQQDSGDLYSYNGSLEDQYQNDDSEEAEE
mmetsp:Transcript_21685/g.33386  ORF Transcript_21685/g.33386 Transcript_21685/m.33386 type:complete len:178 (-) Transcript_21685:47-580(-)|eukprot:CAMPEP_0170491252 /NCGR_PEP_ID=MMETSP0208-20121228/10674_1 /TAXON_ID=197538 /ORGANISM="Strombidium inclinatum, Strain S3" /LENGTH=177 /DNA_ID=CAMNT_0010766799 /DNA_START=234 /DNA_END=767 /DNA_ORIENTATION=+